MFCNQCGRQNGNNARFCVYCGSRLDVENAYPAGVQNNQANLNMYQDVGFEKPKQGNIRIFFQTFNLLLGAMAFLITYILINTMSKDDAAAYTVAADAFALKEGTLLAQILPADLFSKVTEFLAGICTKAVPYIYEYGMYAAGGLGLIGFIFSCSGSSASAWGGARFYRFLLGLLNFALLCISLFFMLKAWGVLAMIGLGA